MQICSQNFSFASLVRHDCSKWKVCVYARRISSFRFILDMFCKLIIIILFPSWSFKLHYIQCLVLGTFQTLLYVYSITFSFNPLFCDNILSAIVKNPQFKETLRSDKYKPNVTCFTEMPFVEDIKRDIVNTLRVDWCAECWHGRQWINTISCIGS